MLKVKLCKLLNRVRMRRGLAGLTGLAGIVGLACLLAPAWAGAENVVDLAGRSITVPPKVQRILLGEGRFVPALAILEGKTPLARVAGMLGEFEKLDPASYAQYRARFPEIDRIPRTGRTTGDSFSVEQAIALKADLAIFGLEGHGPSPHDQATLARLQKAGVTVAFIDFRRDPIRNTPLSIALLGKLLDRQKEATAFNDYYGQELDRVTKRLDGMEAPAVFIENRVGLTEECCATMGDGMMGRFVDLAGGRNIAKGKVPGTHGVLSIEYLLTHQPDIYIGTAIGTIDSLGSEGSNRIILGAGVTPQVARASLTHALNRPAIAQLRAVRAGRAHAVWHHFYSSPLNVAAVQAFAKWQHPERFADLDPDKTLRTLYERFQPVPLDGTYWISMQ